MSIAQVKYLRSVTSKPVRRLIIDTMLAILSLVGAVFGPAPLAPTVHAKALFVDCGDPYNGHCYANQSWYGAIGVKTSETVVPLTCTYLSGNNGCDFIDNEMWLIDKGHSTNPCFCMVEAGYWNDPTAGYSESYFWGDELSASGPIVDHFIKNVPQGDYNSAAVITINADGRYAQAWDIYINGAVDSIFAQSTNNPMNPTGTNSNVQIGMELAGHNSDYASAPDAWFTNNQWANSSGVWSYQTNNGSGAGGLYSHNPPNMQNPTPPANGNNGGRYYTYCCQLASTVVPGSTQIPSSAPSSATSELGLRAIKPTARQQNGAMFDNKAIDSFVLGHHIPRAIAMGASASPTSVQSIVLGTSQDISKLLNNDNMGVPDGTLLYYVKVNGSFAFPTSPGRPDIMTNQAVEVFDATTGNLLIAAS